MQLNELLLYNLSTTNQLPSPNQRLHRHSDIPSRSIQRTPFIFCSNSYWTCMESYKTTKLCSNDVQLMIRTYCPHYSYCTLCLTASAETALLPHRESQPRGHGSLQHLERGRQDRTVRRRSWTVKGSKRLHRHCQGWVLVSWAGSEHVQYVCMYETVLDNCVCVWYLFLKYTQTHRHCLWEYK